MAKTLWKRRHMILVCKPLSKRSLRTIHRHRKEHVLLKWSRSRQLKVASQ